MLTIAGGILLAVLGYYVIGYVASTLFLDGMEEGWSVRRSILGAAVGAGALTLAAVAAILMVRRYL